MPGSILCVGGVTFDTLFGVEKIPTSPCKILPGRALQLAAGMAASAAAAAATLGGRASLWARVGDDDVGVRVREELSAVGIDVSNVRETRGSTPICTVLVDKCGERLVVPYFDAAMSDDATWLPLDIIRDYGAVLADVRWPAGSAATLRAARAQNIPAILDADTAPRPVLDQLVPLATHPVLSQQAAEILTGDSCPRRAAEMLANRLGFVAVTAGHEGCFWSDQETQTIRHSPAPQVTVVDTLAAGDVFHGAFALAIAEGQSLAAAIAFANVAAAIKCTRWGGRSGTPSRDEVLQYLKAGASA